MVFVDLDSRLRGNDSVGDCILLGSARLKKDCRRGL